MPRDLGYPAASVAAVTPQTHRASRNARGAGNLTSCAEMLGVCTIAGWSSRHIGAGSIGVVGIVGDDVRFLGKRERVESCKSRCGRACIQA
jgi:hypothetical protein